MSNTYVNLCKALLGLMLQSRKGSNIIVKDLQEEFFRGPSWPRLVGKLSVGDVARGAPVLAVLGVPDIVCRIQKKNLSLVGTLMKRVRLTRNNT